MLAASTRGLAEGKSRSRVIHGIARRQKGGYLLHVLVGPTHRHRSTNPSHPPTAGAGRAVLPAVAAWSGRLVQTAAASPSEVQQQQKQQKRQERPAAPGVPATLPEVLPAPERGLRNLSLNSINDPQVGSYRMSTGKMQCDAEGQTPPASCLMAVQSPTCLSPCPSPPGAELGPGDEPAGQRRRVLLAEHRQQPVQPQGVGYAAPQRRAQPAAPAGAASGSVWRRKRLCWYCSCSCCCCWCRPPVLIGISSLASHTHLISPPAPALQGFRTATSGPSVQRKILNFRSSMVDPRYHSLTEPELPLASVAGAQLPPASPMEPELPFAFQTSMADPPLLHRPSPPAPARIKKKN